MKLSERMRKNPIYDCLFDKYEGFEVSEEEITEVTQLEEEIALKADYIKRLEAENAVLIKRLCDYEHQASDERIRDEK